MSLPSDLEVAFPGKRPSTTASLPTRSQLCRSSRRAERRRKLAALVAAVGVVVADLTAPPARAAAPPPSNVLGALSTRAHAGSGDDVVISGFIILGSGSKQVLVRGLGTSLQIPSALVDPTLVLHDSNGAAVASNDNWKETQQAAIEATGHAPLGESESAILATLALGSYTVVFAGKNNAVGVGKVDVIDVDSTTSARLGNMSTRAVAAPGDNAIVGGFVINGPQNRRVIIRALGTSLFFIDRHMGDPTLRLRDSGGNPLVFSDDWKDTQQGEIEATGIPPTEPAESAIVATLAPGSYSAELIGACGAGGVAVFEIFDLGQDTGAISLPASSLLPTCFSTWVIERGLTGADAARTADPDGDGDSNFLEYAAGKNPKVADGPATNGGIVEVEGEKYLSLSFTWPTGDAAPSDITYRVERATALAPANWLSSPTHLVVHSIAAGPGALETVTVRSKHPLGATAREFLRLKITATTE